MEATLPACSPTDHVVMINNSTESFAQHYVTAMSRPVSETMSQITDSLHNRATTHCLLIPYLSPTLQKYCITHQ